MPNNSRRINITWEKHSATSYYGWFHRIDGGDRIPILNPDAVSALDDIVRGREVPGEHIEHLKDSILWQPGDRVSIDGVGLPGYLGDLLERHT